MDELIILIKQWTTPGKYVAGSSQSVQQCMLCLKHELPVVLRIECPHCIIEMLGLPEPTKGDPVPDDPDEAPELRSPRVVMGSKIGMWDLPDNDGTLGRWDKD